MKDGFERQSREGWRQGVEVKRERKFASGKGKKSRMRRGRFDKWREGGVRILLSHLSPLAPWISLNKARNLCGSVTLLISTRLHHHVHHQIMKFPWSSSESKSDGDS